MCLDKPSTETLISILRLFPKAPSRLTWQQRTAQGRTCKYSKGQEEEEVSAKFLVLSREACLPLGAPAPMQRPASKSEQGRGGEKGPPLASTSWGHPRGRVVIVEAEGRVGSAGG